MNVFGRVSLGALVARRLALVAALAGACIGVQAQNQSGAGLDGGTGTAGQRPRGAAQASEVQQKPGFACPPGSYWFEGAGGNPTCIGGAGVAAAASCSGGPRPWYASDGSVCEATLPASGDGALVGPLNSVSGNAGQASFRCAGGAWQTLPGSTCQGQGGGGGGACGPAQLTWSVGAEVCSGSVTSAAAGQTRVAVDGPPGAQGQASFACSGGVWAIQSGATCQGGGGSGGGCRAQSLAWSQGAQSCAGSVLDALEGASVSVAASTGGSGQATAVCSGGAWSLLPGASCLGGGGGGTACPAGALSWQSSDGLARCEGPVAASPAGVSAAVRDDFGATAGAATFSCGAGGTWSQVGPSTCKLVTGCTVVEARSQVSCASLHTTVNASTGQTWAQVLGLSASNVVGTVDVQTRNCGGRLEHGTANGVCQPTTACVGLSTQACTDSAGRVGYQVLTGYLSDEACRPTWPWVNGQQVPQTQAGACIVEADCPAQDLDWTATGTYRDLAANTWCSGRTNPMNVGDPVQVVGSSRGTGVGSVEALCTARGMPLALSRNTCAAACPDSVSAILTADDGVTQCNAYASTASGYLFDRTDGALARTNGTEIVVVNSTSTSHYANWSADFRCQGGMWQLQAGARCTIGAEYTGGGGGSTGATNCIGTGTIGALGQAYAVGTEAFASTINPSDGSTVNVVYQCSNGGTWVLKP